MVSELLQKYIWLVQTFIRAGHNGLSLSEICDKWENRWGTEYSRRSFNNHREAVYDTFGITIGCDRTTNRYYIEDAESLGRDDSQAAWLINTFTVGNLLSQSHERLKGRVSVEDIPSGRKYLTAMMEAMEGNYVLKIGYMKYRSTEPSEYTVRPYAVKEADKRWYLVGWCEERSSLRVYGLDRIKSMETLPRTFKLPSGFDVDELFATCYGVYLPEEGARAGTITFKASPTEAKFLSDLPLHPTQEIVGQDPDGVVFSIFVCPNEKLIMDILSRGDRLEILSPAHLRETLAASARAMAELYENKTKDKI